MITDIMSRQYALRPLRGDEHELHASDLASCEHQVHARRNGKPMMPFDGSTYRKFDYGLDYEKRVIDALKLEFGDSNVLTDLVVAYRGVTGHPDAVINHKDGYKVVLEIKTTIFYNGGKPKEPKLSHILQAAMYALATGADHFFVHIVCRNSGDAVDFGFDTEDYRAIVDAAIDRMTASTAIGAEAPFPAPPEHSFNQKTGKSWMCEKYCSYAECGLNALTKGRVF